MNTQLLQKIEASQLKKVPEIKPGDTVRVHQKIREGNKERIQVFEGVVLRVKGGGIRATFTVRKISFGVGVEKTFLLNSPKLAKIEVKKRAKVRRAYLTYLRALSGKSARLKDKQFDALAVNVKEEEPEEEAPKVESADEKTDAEITELSEEEIAEPLADESIDEVVREENKEAAADAGEDEYTGKQAEEGDNEAEVLGEEFAEGVFRADKDAETGKAKEGERAEETAEEVPTEELADEIKEDQDADNQ